MHLIVYTSEYTGKADEAPVLIGDIVRTSKQNNPEHDITGVLFYQNGQFLQVIEGEEADLRTLMANIEADKRHKNITMLFDEPILRRGFEQWNMDVFNLDAAQTLDLDEMIKISDAIKATIIPRADHLVELIETFLQNKTFRR